MKVLSLHSAGHDTGVAYFEDGRLVFAVETERLTRVKHDHRCDVALRHVEREGDPLYSAVRRMWDRRDPLLTRFDFQDISGTTSTPARSTR